MTLSLRLLEQPTVCRVFPHFEVQHGVGLNSNFNLLLLFFDGSAILRKVTKPRHQASRLLTLMRLRSKILFLNSHHPLKTLESEDVNLCIVS